MDRILNTATGDYTPDRAATLQTAVYIRLVTPKGHYWADPALGSRLHELAREKDTPRVHRLAEQYAQQALSPLIVDGRALAIRTQAIPWRPGFLALQIEVDQTGGETVTFTHPVRIA